MKNKEEIKKEILSYLKESSNHLFKIDDKEHKILFNDNLYICITGKDICISDIDRTIDIWNSDSKNVIKNSLFLTPRYYNKSIKTIPNYKDAKLKHKLISDKISGKSDKNEVRDIISNLI